MRTDSTPRLLAIYHDGSPHPYPLHGPTVICIFMKPNTIPPFFPRSLLFGQWKI